MADSGYKSISRIDVPKRRTHGFQVRLWHNGKMYNKFFNDNHYPTREDVLQAAVEYRNELEAELGKPRSERPVITQNARNNTGVVGVNRIWRKSKAISPSGAPYYYDLYEVVWNPQPNKLKKKVFSIDKLGDEEAFRQAVAFRKEMVRRYYYEHDDEMKNEG